MGLFAGVMGVLATTSGSLKSKAIRLFPQVVSRIAKSDEQVFEYMVSVTTDDVLSVDCW